MLVAVYSAQVCVHEVQGAVKRVQLFGLHVGEVDVRQVPVCVGDVLVGGEQTVPARCRHRVLLIAPSVNRKRIG